MGIINRLCFFIEFAINKFVSEVGAAAEVGWKRKSRWERSRVIISRILILGRGTVTVTGRRQVTETDNSKEDRRKFIKENGVAEARESGECAKRSGKFFVHQDGLVRSVCPRMQMNRVLDRILPDTAAASSCFSYGGVCTATVLLLRANTLYSILYRAVTAAKLPRRVCGGKPPVTFYIASVRRRVARPCRRKHRAGTEYMDTGSLSMN